MKYKKFSKKEVLGRWGRGSKDLKLYLRLDEMNSEENSLHYKNKKNKKSHRDAIGRRDSLKTDIL